MTKIASLFGHKLSALSYQEDKYWVLPNCNVGIEIEVEQVHTPMRTAGLVVRPVDDWVFADQDMRAHWDIHIDNSLRDHGLEFVTKTVFGKDLTNALTMLDNMVKLFPSLKIKHNFSSRCGTHVHLDVRDLDKQELLSLIILYTLYEYVLFEYWDANRAHNVYCVPMGECTLMHDTFAHVLATDDLTRIKNYLGQIGEELRYSALNIAALRKQGSLEFRHAYGTFDIQKIKNWIQIIFCMKKYILGKTAHDVLVHLTQSPFYDLSLEIFGKEYFSILFPRDFGYYKQMLINSKAALKTITVGFINKKQKALFDATGELYNQFLYEAKVPKELGLLAKFMNKNGAGPNETPQPIKPRAKKRPITANEYLTNYATNNTFTAPNTGNATQGVTADQLNLDQRAERINANMRTMRARLGRLDVTPEGLELRQNTITQEAQRIADQMYNYAQPQNPDNWADDVYNALERDLNEGDNQ